MGENTMANSQWRTGLLAFGTLVLLAAGIAACDRAPERPPETPTAQVGPAPALPPAAATVTEGARPVEGANANDQPMKSMTKAEESNSMPMPGQANDDSTVAKDSKK